MRTDFEQTLKPLRLMKVKPPVSCPDKSRDWF